MSDNGGHHNGGTQRGGEVNTSVDTTTQPTNSTDHTPDTAGPFGVETVKCCVGAVDNFRTGAIPKVQAISDILLALGAVQDVPKEVFNQTAQTYFDMLDSWIRAQQHAQEKGTIAGSGGSPRRPSSPNVHEAQSMSPDRDTRPYIGEKHRRAPADESDDEDEPRKPKKSLDLSTLPWFEDSERDTLPEPLEKTRTLVEQFAEDPKQWKTFFTNRRNCPQLPDSEWTNIIAGKAVNLDAVHTSIFSVSLDNKHKERVGRLSIVFEDATPSKSVVSHGDWLAAWQRASAGIAFIFRHRAAELEAYRDHISQYFTVVGEARQHAVINYDKGVRVRVGSRHDLLLTDIQAFHDLQIYWITAVGGGSAGSSSSSGGTRASGKPRKRDPCHKWNDGRCARTSKDCNYAHVCESCRSPTHTARACSGGNT